MTHPPDGTCGIMHRAAELVLTIPQGTALTVLVPMSNSVPRPAACRLPQPTHRADILCNVYISTLSRKCQDAELDSGKKVWKGEWGVGKGRCWELFEGAGCKVGAGDEHCWANQQWHPAGGTKRRRCGKQNTTLNMSSLFRPWFKDPCRAPAILHRCPIFGRMERTTDKL